MKMFPITMQSAAEPPAGANPPVSLSSIQESFFTRSFDIDAVSGWTWALGVLCLLLLAVTVFKALRARRIRYNPYGSIRDPRSIRSILRNAFDQRRPFEIQFHTENEQRRPTLRCAPEYLGKDSMTLEVSGLKSLSDKWLKRQVVAFFRIQIGNEFTYYTFTSRIESIHAPRPGICHLTLLIPQTLENRQKRSFLRIAPPKEFLLGAAIWHGDTMPSTEALNDITRWPLPKLLLIHDKVEQFQVLDLSAGGVRISIPHTTRRNMNIQFAAPEQLLLMLDLYDPENNKRLRFWLQCRIQNAWVEHSSRELHVGTQFQAWGRPKEAPEYSFLADDVAGIEWLRLPSTQEVEPLGNWIMRRHLELFREAPFDKLQNPSLASASF